MKFFSSLRKYVGLALLIAAAFSMFSVPVTRAQDGNAPVSSPVSGPPVSPPVSGPPAPAKTSPTTFTLTNPLGRKFDSIGAVAQAFVEIFSYIVVLFAVLMIIWTGLQYITAQGNPQKLTELNRRMLMIVIGVAVVIGARIIIAIVINTLEATQLVNKNVIESVRDANK